MRIAIISDIHSNLCALEAVRKDIIEQKVDITHCLGDIIGYGPYPMECLNMTMGMCKIVLKGNHEDCVCHSDLEYELNSLAIEGVKFSRSRVSEFKNVLDKLPTIVKLPDLDFVMCHGAPTEPHAWKYISSPWEAKEELKHSPHRICLVGHTHNPFVFGSDRGLYKEIKDDFVLDEKQKFIVNVGSVGQPRDGDVRASYGIFDISKEVVFNLRRVFYDISKTDKAIRKFKISAQLAERLYSGI